MTVKINKPEINIREKLSELDKPVGVAGQSMIAAETSQQQFNLIGAGRTNLLINAQFEGSQRGNYQVDNGGTGWTASSPTYGVDRWYAYGNGVAVTTSTSYQQLPTGQSVLAMKCVSTGTSASSFLHPAQNFEVAKWMEGQDFTFSCWVRTNRTDQYVRFCNTLVCWTISEEVPADGEWHYMTGTQNMGTGISLTSSAQFQPAFGGGAMAVGDYVEFALPQVELGRVATPFEFRSYGEELQLCQRYFEVIGDEASVDSNGSSSTETLIGLGFVYQTSRVFGHLRWKVTKRENPTCTINSATDLQCLSTAGGGAWINATSAAIRASKEGARIDIATGSAMAGVGTACEIRFNTSSPVGYIYIDAEI
jgi:hypothetical protein